MVAVLPPEYAARAKYNPVGRLSRLTDVSLTLITQIPAVLKTSMRRASGAERTDDMRS